MSKRIIIVGGVAGGATAAARLRRMDENARIILLERGEFISFANCGLPYHVGGIIENREDLLIQSPEGMAEKFNIDVRPLNEAVHINRQEKTVTIRKVKTGETYIEDYDYLVLSPGANPVMPGIPGLAESKNLFTLKTIPDMDVILDFIKRKEPKKAVIIGGGYIGIEMLENLHLSGIKLTLVEMANQIMGPMDYEMACFLHNYIKDKDIRLILNDGVKSFEEEGNKILLQSGVRIDTDMTIFAIGIRPETHLASEAGLELGEIGGIVVNELLQTSDQDIYAIGDAIEVKDFINGNSTYIPLAGPANKQGRIVANNICGRKESYKGTMGTAVVKVFDMTAASTGNNEKILKKLGIGYEVIHIYTGSHAGYYPGSFPIAMKIIFDKESGNIHGAQAVGYEGVEKRIDVIATAIRGGLKIIDLQELELSYAPPYSSAKDPVNMLGFVGANIIDGLVYTFQWNEVDCIIRQGGYLIDVREKAERQISYIQGSVHIPLGEIRSRLDEIPKDQTIYIYCLVGIRGYIASRILNQKGYKTKNLDGGYKLYQTVYQANSVNNDRVPIDDAGMAKIESEHEEITQPTIKINVCGLQCPGPIMEVYKNIQKMKDGETLEVLATDPGFLKDIESWCGRTGNSLIESGFENKVLKCLIQRGRPVFVIKII